MTSLKKIAGFILALMAIFSILLTLFAIGDLFGDDPKGRGAGFFIGLTVFFGLASWLLGKTARQLLTSNTIQLSKDIEREILLLAKESNGRLTVAELAAHTNLSIDESQAKLEKMVTQGVVQMDLQEDGAIHYIFPGLS